MYLFYSSLCSLNWVSKFQTQFNYVFYIDIAHKYLVQYSLYYARKSRGTLNISIFVPRPTWCWRPSKVFVFCAPRNCSSIQILKLASQLYSIIPLKCTMPKGRVLIPVNADRCLHAKPLHEKVTSQGLNVHSETGFKLIRFATCSEILSPWMAYWSSETCFWRNKLHET